MTIEGSPRFRNAVRTTNAALLAVVAACAFNACRGASLHGPSSGCTTPSSATSSPSAPPLPSVESSSAAPTQAASLPHEPNRGCAENVDATLSVDRQLEQLGTTCAPGMQRVPGAEAGKLSLDANACVRVALASATQNASARLEIVEPGGRVVAAASGRLPMLVGRDGAVCVRVAGDYELRVVSRESSEAVAMAVWRAP